MDMLDKLGRLAKLGSILGIALGAAVLTMCGGRTGDDGQDATAQDATAYDAGVDAGEAPDGGADASPPDDGSTDPLDAQLWDVICE